MKKIFTLIAAAFLAVSANAQLRQLIYFTENEVASAGTLNGKSFGDEYFGFTVQDEPGKVAIDANNSFFGDELYSLKYTHRLKSGGKSQFESGKYLQLNFVIPSYGNLRIGARTGSNSAEDRTVVITQNGSELYNAVVKESDAVKVKGLDESDPDKDINVYPIIDVSVSPGTLEVTFPVGSINFYFFEFEEGGSGPMPTIPTPPTVWDFTGEIGSSDLAALESDTENWKYDEANNRYTNEYVLAKVADGYNDQPVNANGQSLELLYGLNIGRYNNKLNAGNLRIDNGKGLGLNGSDVVLAIPGLVFGDIVKVRYASTNDEARGFKVTNADIAETKLQDKSERAEETMTVASDGKLILQTTAGLYVYALAVNADLPVDTGIKTIAENGNKKVVIYNLAGQQVRSAQKGVYIQNGKKFVVK